MCLVVRCVLQSFVQLQRQGRNPCRNLILTSITSETCGGAWSPLGGIFDVAAKAERLAEVNRELEQPNVWDDPQRAQALGRERAQLAAVVESTADLERGLRDAAELLALAGEENDPAAVADVARDLQRYEGQVAELEFRRMFAGEMDASNAFLDIQAGSGGTEAQDWANMLLRMYLR